MKEFQRFPLLKDEIVKVVSGLLKERLPLANSMVRPPALCYVVSVHNIALKNKLPILLCYYAHCVLQHALCVGTCFLYYKYIVYCNICTYVHCVLQHMYVCTLCVATYVRMYTVCCNICTYVHCVLQHSLCVATYVRMYTVCCNVQCVL